MARKRARGSTENGRPVTARTPPTPVEPFSTANAPPSSPAPEVRRTLTIVNRPNTLIRAITVALVATASLSCEALKRSAVKAYPQAYEAQGDPTVMAPVLSGPDEARRVVAIALTQVAGGFTQPTAAEFVPGEPTTLWVLEKTGALKWTAVDGAASGTLASLDVTTSSEQGLLGLAFHPRFADTRRFVLHYTTRKAGVDVSRVELWEASGESMRMTGVEPVRVVLELAQPYANHNGGHVAFGPDGYLYVGFGDGGFRDDPGLNGQNGATWLGAMLRVDVDAPVAGRGYAVPDDNPFIDTAGFAPEVWAIGLRNPWRYAFDPKGRLLVADVGQDLYEEVDVVAAGDNLGWNVREGRHCFAPKQGCATQGLVEPIFEYGRAEGQSVTGGVVSLSTRVPALAGRYVFGDFVSGRLWALPLPDGVQAVEPVALGKWPILPSHFARDAAGEVYVVDFGAGRVLRVDAQGP